MTEITLLTAQPDPAKRAQQILDVATKLAGFIKAARHTLDIAIYDFRLSGEAADLVIGAIEEAAGHGAKVRVGYFEAKPRSHSTRGRAAATPHRTRRTTENFAAIGGDPAPAGNAKFLSRLSNKVQTKGIAELDADVEKEAIDGMSHLMHDKYIVRDGKSLWTGSTNFTNDAFSLQENNIVVLDSADICKLYANDFEEMWEAGTISNSGKDDTGEAEVDGSTIDVAFSPGQGRTIDHDIATRIGAAAHEIAIASMVISSAGILGALVDALDRGVTVTGIYDATQMKGVERDWQKSSAASQAKLSLWETVRSHLVGKVSTPFGETTPHDFMHNKLMVIDTDTVVTGSFNFSNNATRNAENVLMISDTAIAKQYRDYVDGLVEMYRDSSPH